MYALHIPLRIKSTHLLSLLARFIVRWFKISINAGFCWYMSLASLHAFRRDWKFIDFYSPVTYIWQREGNVCRLIVGWMNALLLILRQQLEKLRVFVVDARISVFQFKQQTPAFLLTVRIYHVRSRFRNFCSEICIVYSIQHFSFVFEAKATIHSRIVRKSGFFIYKY